jgi:hypothetical protein
MVDIKISDKFMGAIVGTNEFVIMTIKSFRCACKTKLDLNEDALKKISPT